MHIFIHGARTPIWSKSRRHQTALTYLGNIWNASPSLHLRVARQFGELSRSQYVPTRQRQSKPFWTYGTQPISLDGVRHLDAAKQRLESCEGNRKHDSQVYCFTMQPFLREEQKDGGDCVPFMALRKISPVALIALEWLSERLDAP